VHDAGNTILAAPLTSSLQIRGVLHIPGHCPHASHGSRSAPLVFNRPIRQRLMQPRIKTSSIRTQHPTHRGYAMFVPMMVNKSVLLLLAPQHKYRADFFNMSRSSSTRRSWERNLRISLLAAISSAACSWLLSGRTAFTHLYKLWADTPRRSDTSETGYPRSTICRTASSLN